MSMSLLTTTTTMKILRRATLLAPMGSGRPVLLRRKERDPVLLSSFLVSVWSYSS